MTTGKMPAPAVGRAAGAADTIAPDGSEIRLLATTRQGATRASLCEVRLAPGAVSRAVSHRTVEEIWYVVAGRGLIWRSPDGAAADPVAVEPGDAVVIPTGWRFQFRADAGSGLRFLCFTVPAWPGPDEAEPLEAGPLGAPTVPPP